MNHRPLIAIAATLLLPQPAWSSPPDAGVLQQQLNRQNLSLPRLESETLPQTEVAKPTAGPELVVQRFRISGNTLIETTELEAIVHPYTTHPISFADLQLAAAAIGDLYRNAGWVARVYLPAQEVEAGVVEIKVVESRFGQWRLDGTSPQSFDTSRIAGYIQAGQASTTPLNRNVLDRSLLLLDDLPGISVVGHLVSGADNEQTDLVLQVGDEASNEGQLNLDNFGSRSTGVTRLSGEIYVKSPMKMGDQLHANLTHSEGADALTLAYSVPVGFKGWRIGVNGSHLRYKVIQEPFDALRGHSFTLGLNAHYPLIRARDKNLYVSIAYDAKRYNNRSDAITTSNYKVPSTVLSLSGNSFDRLGGAGANTMNVSVSSGNVALGAIDSNEEPSLSGGFTKLNYGLSRQQAVTAALSLYASVHGQWSEGNLDSSERFYLGGPTGVRAYPVSEAGGDEGVITNIELRYRLSNDFVLSGFYDWGHIRQSKHNNNVGGSDLNVYHLHGTGIGLSWTGPHGIKINGVFARRIGHNPNAVTGNDQDGSLIKNRVWLNLTAPF